MIQLQLPNSGELRLDFNSAQRFSECTFSFIEKTREITLYVDYLYIFVEAMLGRLQNMADISDPDLFGKAGKWQELYYFDFPEIEAHSKEIRFMQDSLFVSAEKYGSFLYRYNRTAWLEINNGYNECCGLSPAEFYSDPHNFRLLLTAIPEKTLNEWETALRKVKSEYAPK